MKRLLSLLTLMPLLTSHTLASDFVALCSTGTPEEITATIAAGANVNATNEEGRTPLMNVVNRKSGLLTALIKAGADVNARDSFGYTPLMRAAIDGDSVETVNVLLDAKARLDATNNYGQTAVELAAHGKNPDIVLRLVNATLGIDTNAVVSANAPNAPSKEARAAFASGIRWARQNTADADQRAAKDFEQASVLSPDAKWPELHYNLGLVNTRLIQYQEAIRGFSRYLELKPQADDAAGVRSQIARLRYLQEKKRRGKELHGTWLGLDGGLNLYAHEADVAAGVCIQEEAFVPYNGANAKWDRVPVQQNGGLLTLRYDVRIAPPTGAHTKSLPYWNDYHPSYPVFVQLRQVSPRLLEGIVVRGKNAPRRIICRKNSDAPVDRPSRAQGALAAQTWPELCSTLGLTAEEAAKELVQEGITAIEVAESKGDIEEAVTLFERARKLSPSCPAVYYNLATAKEMLATWSHYNNAITHLEAYMEMAVLALEKKDAEGIRDRIAAKLEKLSDNQTLPGIWVPRQQNSFYDEPRLEIRKGATGALEARALGSKFMEPIVPQGPWVPCNGDTALSVNDARYYTACKEVSSDCGPVSVTFMLSRSGEDRLEGLIISVRTDPANKNKTVESSDVGMFEREETINSP